MIEVLKQVRQIVWRYRHETPLGNQPHLIAHEADETINRIDQAIEQAEKQEPVAVVSSVAQVGDKGVSVRWLGGFPQIGDRLYTSPPQRQPLDGIMSIAYAGHRVVTLSFHTVEQARAFRQYAVAASHSIAAEALEKQENT